MKRSLAAPGIVLAAAALALALLAASAARRDAPPPRRVPPPAPELVDVAIACLAAGETEPPLAALADEDLGAAIEIVARLVGAYQEGDFAAFRALRAGDLEFAARARRGDVGELALLCRQLGVPVTRLSEDWGELLATFWEAYYATRAIARVRPEGCALALHREGLQGRRLEAWESDFEAGCAGRGGFRVDHRLVVPHRRSLERVAADSGALRWLDLELAFEATDGALGVLIARFVWDGATREWFLHRATTVLDGELRDDRRHLVL